MDKETTGAEPPRAVGIRTSGAGGREPDERRREADGGAPGACADRPPGASDRNGSTAVALDWEALARFCVHPLRISILEVLGLDGGRTLSPSDLSRELQASLGVVNYHVGELTKGGLLELIDTRHVRGAVEHFYRLPETGGTRR